MRGKPRTLEDWPRSLDASDEAKIGDSLAQANKPRLESESSGDNCRPWAGRGDTDADMVQIQGALPGRWWGWGGWGRKDRVARGAARK